MSNLEPLPRAHFGVLTFRHEHARRPLSRVVLAEAERGLRRKINNPEMVTATDSFVLLASVIRSTEPDSI